MLKSFKRSIDSIQVTNDQARWNQKSRTVFYAMDIEDKASRITVYIFENCLSDSVLPCPVTLRILCKLIGENGAVTASECIRRNSEMLLWSGYDTGDSEQPVFDSDILGMNKS